LKIKNTIKVVMTTSLLSAFGIATAGEVAMDSAKQAEMMAMFMQMAQPGEEHKKLEPLAGTWDVEIKMWSQPGAEPMLFKGRGTSRMILGSRFLESRSTSGEGEMYTEALTILGYDKRHKKYTSVGYDTWGTYYVAATGEYDPKTNSVVMGGEDYDPTTKFTQKWDFVLRFIDKDKYVWEVIFKDEMHTQGKGPFKMVEITSTRVKEKK